MDAYSTNVPFFQECLLGISEMATMLRYNVLITIGTPNDISNVCLLYTSGGSAFESRTAIELEDESSELIYEELLSCGRAACGERFAYRFFHSLSEVSCKGKLIYRENNRFRPASWPMEEQMCIRDRYLPCAVFSRTGGLGRYFWLSVTGRAGPALWVIIRPFIRFSYTRCQPLLQVWAERFM